MRRTLGAILGFLAVVAAVLPLCGLAAAGSEVQEGVGFVALDIFVNAGPASLGAYQVELKADAGSAKVVGIEGGEHAAYAQPPYYDPAALHEDQLKERIILAAFSTGPELPSGRTRVARIHVRIVGEATYKAAVMTAGAADGTKVEATVQVVPVR